MHVYFLTWLCWLLNEAGFSAGGYRQHIAYSGRPEEGHPSDWLEPADSEKSLQPSEPKNNISIKPVPPKGGGDYFRIRGPASGHFRRDHIHSPYTTTQHLSKSDSTFPSPNTPSLHVPVLKDKLILWIAIYVHGRRTGCQCFVRPSWYRSWGIPWGIP